MNSKNDDKNDINISLVKDKDKTNSSEATEGTKKRKHISKKSYQRINFKDSLKYHNIVSILILNGLKTHFMTREPNVSKGYTLKVFQFILTRIILNVMF